MPALSTWNLDQTRLLTRRELAAVLTDLAPRAARSANVHRNLVIVRLACCCGLRVAQDKHADYDPGRQKTQHVHRILLCEKESQSSDTTPSDVNQVLRITQLLR